MFVCFCLSLSAAAQMQGELIFTGNTRLGVNGMGEDFWTDIENDTIRFQMTGQSTGDITLPTMHYTPMNMTMQGFTLKDAKFTMGEDQNIVFEKGQTFEMTVMDNGAEKDITATLDSASWAHSGEMLFQIAVTFKYGRMPMPAVYIGALAYNREATAISEVMATDNNRTAYDLMGRKLTNKPSKGIIIKNRKKLLVK